jgi:hypothetical protein
MTDIAQSMVAPSSHKDSWQFQRSGVDMVAAYRSILHIIAYLDETQYTESNSSTHERQTEVVEHSDLADPASDPDTSQG